MADTDDSTASAPPPRRRTRKAAEPKAARTAAPRAKTTKAESAAKAPAKRKAPAKKAASGSATKSAAKKPTGVRKVAGRVSAAARDAAATVADTAKKPGVIAAIAAGAGAAIAAGAVAYSRRKGSGGKSAATEGHAVPDLASDKPHKGPADRAPDAFRPDPTASVPDSERAAFAPALVKETPAGD